MWRKVKTSENPPTGHMKNLFLNPIVVKYYKMKSLSGVI